MRISRTLSLLIPAALVLGGSVPVAGAADPSPQQQLEAAAKSFAKVRSYRVQMTIKDDDGTSRIKADVTTSGRVDVTVSIGNTGTVRLRKISSTTYIRGDARYWKAAGGRDGDALAKQLANRWIRADKADAKEFTEIFDEVSPKKLARCLVNTDAMGTLTAGQPTTVGGKKANVLIDAGDKPGVAPGKLFIAAEGPPLPLRMQQTGKAQPGGKEGPCTSADDTSTSSDARFSRYNEKLTIKTPKNALSIPSGDSGLDSTPA